MTGKLQGFVIRRNLEEVPNSFNAVNNLGESPIASDISLFKNNKRNVSTLSFDITNLNLVTNYIFFPNRSNVFSNGTKVLYNSIVYYYVKNSNGINSFQLSNDPGLVSTVILNVEFVGTLARSDEITFENITNYAKNRRQAITARSAGAAADIGGTFSIEPFTTNVQEQVLAFEDNLNFFKNLKNNSVVKTQNFNTGGDFLSQGHLVISDPDGVNNLSLTANSGPGIFIYNAASGTKLRAFSDTKNVWAANIANTFLETTARKITVGRLSVIANTVASNTVIIQQKPGSSENLVVTTVTPIDVTDNVNTSAFNHKLKVTINGEEYSLCLSNTALMN